MAQEGGNLTGVWTVNHRAAFRNRTDTGVFESWTGHAAIIDWREPLGFVGARLAAGVFNLNNTGLTVDIESPGSFNGPTAAGWARTFILAFNLRF